MRSGDRWLVLGAVAAAAAGVIACGSGDGDGGGGSGASGGDGGEVGCGSLTACAGGCVDLQADSRNCGACDIACAAGQACIDGGCATSCPAGQTLCVDDTPSCEDLLSSGGNCGACNNRCPSGTDCQGGICAGGGGGGSGGDGGGGGGLSCAPGETLCVDETPSCEDLGSSGGNCGACNNRCPSGTSCEDGICTSVTIGGGGDGGEVGSACSPGETLCADDTPSCEDLRSSNGNCGACNHRCPEDRRCSGGICR